MTEQQQRRAALRERQAERRIFDTPYGARTQGTTLDKRTLIPAWEAALRDVGRYVFVRAAERHERAAHESHMNNVTPTDLAPKESQTHVRRC
jgi:hypothetical protein